VNLFFGLLVAWVLVRYKFFGKKVVDALVDLPFALPTAVAGIALTAIYAPNGWIGKLLVPLGIKVAYTPLGFFIALTFSGCLRGSHRATVLEDLEAELEEAAASLGANRWQTFRRVNSPAPLSGVAHGLRVGFRPLACEYGSVVFHLRQHADENGDNAAAHHHQAGAIRLCGPPLRWPS